MIGFEWVSHRDNFLLRMEGDGCFRPHSDLVARIRVGKLDKRLVVLADSARLRRARRGRARAALMLPQIANLPASPKDRDDLYLEALRQDGAPHRWASKLYRRVRGYLRWQWRYGKLVGQ
jgi:hypothetical protein